MTLLDPVKGKQPLRTVGELREFIKDLPDGVLLESFTQYNDEATHPVVAEIEAEQEGCEFHWLGQQRLSITGYEQYQGDPDLEDKWKLMDLNMQPPSAAKPKEVYIVEDERSAYGAFSTPEKAAEAEHGPLGEDGSVEVMRYVEGRLQTVKVPLAEEVKRMMSRLADYPVITKVPIDSEKGWYRDS